MNAVLLALCAAPLVVVIVRDVLTELRRRRAAARAAADLAIVNALWSAEVDNLTPAQWDAWFSA